MKLTAVDYSIKPVSCINAEHGLFLYLPTISRVSRFLSLGPASGRRVGDEGISGLCGVAFSSSVGRRVNDSGL